ncbi:MAG: helix-hairpin-helix domain-containing protein [Myxococcales bacterium]|nr:helix-hairpin-helix domain-containing protein [Myxococcales bacterium]MDD9970157.1 helix-hairpin-helix domain-containing protein [Myxococcales bacterium]
MQTTIITRNVGPTAIAVALLLSPPGDAQAQETQRTAAQLAPARGPDNNARRAEPGSPGVVNLNSASEAELSLLPGIGTARARAIVTLRKRLKRFTRVEQLMRVKGIGRKTFRKLRPMLTIVGPTTLTERVRRSYGARKSHR